MFYARHLCVSRIIGDRPAERRGRISESWFRTSSSFIHASPHGPISVDPRSVQILDADELEGVVRCTVIENSHDDRSLIELGPKAASDLFKAGTTPESSSRLHGDEVFPPSLSNVSVMF